MILSSGGGSATLKLLSDGNLPLLTSPSTQICCPVLNVMLRTFDKRINCLDIWIFSDMIRRPCRNYPCLIIFSPGDTGLMLVRRVSERSCLSSNRDLMLDLERVQVLSGLDPKPRH